MRCPFGEEVGAPPSIVKCARGFPGCACADDIMRDDTDETDDQSHMVMAWWREHDGL